MSGEKAPEIVTPRTATAGSLLSQWWTLGEIILDRRTNGSGRHTKVAWVIIDRHMQAKGNSRASIRFIEQATGLSKGIIIKACRELVEWGYMTQRTGIGTRPTEYSPNWSSVSPASNTKSNLSSVLQESNASVPLESNTTDISVLPVSNESYLPKPADKAELQVGRNIDTHGATLAGLTPAAAPRDPEEKKKPFDIFWQTFPRKYKKPKARAAWDKLNPSEELADRIIEAASLWAEHYTINPIDKKWMPSPANWLAGERYDEDLPEIYEDPKERAISKAKDRPAKAKPYAHSVVKGGINEMYIVGVREEGTYMSDVHRVTLDLEYVETGEILTHELHIQDVNGPSSGQPGWIALNKAVDWTFNIADIKGQPVKVANMSDGTIGFSKSFLAPKEEIVEVAITGANASPIEPGSEEECLEIKMMTDDDVTIEWFAMLKCDDHEEQMEDQRRIACLLRAVGVTGVDDERDLIGKRLKIIKQGKGVKEFLPHPDMMKNAA